jgi:Domain of unknown function DUF11
VPSLSDRRAMGARSEAPAGSARLFLLLVAALLAIPLPADAQINLGVVAAQDVIIRDVLPAGTPLAGLTPSAGGLCDTPPVGSTGTIMCTWAGLTAVGPEAARLVEVVLRVDPGLTGGTLSNAATVESLTFDPDLTNNGASSTV